jgi:hypothetical protein
MNTVFASNSINLVVASAKSDEQYKRAHAEKQRWEWVQVREHKDEAANQRSERHGPE